MIDLIASIGDSCQSFYGDLHSKTTDAGNAAGTGGRIKFLDVYNLLDIFIRDAGTNPKVMAVRPDPTNGRHGALDDRPLGEHRQE